MADSGGNTTPQGTTVTPASSATALTSRWALALLAGAALALALLA